MLTPPLCPFHGKIDSAGSSRPENFMPTSRHGSVASAAGYPLTAATHRRGGGDHVVARDPGGCPPALTRLDFTTAPAYLTAIMAEKSDPNSKLIAENRRARFDYHIEDDIEAGIMLEGSEVKSLRLGGSNIAESYASVEGGELWLINGYIAPYVRAKTFGHEERRKRKLLVSKKQLSRCHVSTGCCRESSILGFCH